MRGILLVIFALIITSAVVFFLFYWDESGGINNQKVGGGGLERITPLSEVDTPINMSGSPNQSEQSSFDTGQAAPRESAVYYIEAADKYLKEALSITDPKQRFVLIEKINGFKESYESVSRLTGFDHANIESVIHATAGYIAEWSPFYYYIHPDAQAVLGPMIKMLERERAEILEDLAKRGAHSAGRLATEDIEYYIEDMRKSAARRNSDFITFSLQDYERYRKFFDELAEKHQDFIFGFAEYGYILFDDLYRMREEVDEDYIDKTRKKVSAIEAELSTHLDWRSEIRDIMESDYAFYKNIQL